MMGRFDTIIGVLVLLSLGRHPKPAKEESKLIARRIMCRRNALVMAINLECLGSRSASSLGITGGIPWCDTAPVLDASDSEFLP